MVYAFNGSFITKEKPMIKMTMVRISLHYDWLSIVVVVFNSLHYLSHDSQTLYVVIF